MKTIFLVMASAALLTAAALGAAIGEQPAKPGKPLDAADTKFVVAAVQDGETEVRLGDLAVKLSPSPQVREFGSMMSSDHGKANAELRGICSNRGVVLPTEIDPEHQKMFDELAKKQGTDFQGAYVNQMISAHQAAVAMFERAARTTSDAELKAFIEKTLPTLRHHLQMAEELKTTGK